MWIAYYKDDSQLVQFNADIENKFSDIDLANLKKFKLLNCGKSGCEDYITIHLDTGKINIGAKLIDFGYNDIEHRLIYFRRIQKTIGGVPIPDKIIEYAGWQATVDGKNIKRIICFDNGEYKVVCE
jgi:hypothetical protein